MVRGGRGQREDVVIQGAGPFLRVTSKLVLRAMSKVWCGGGGGIFSATLDIQDSLELTDYRADQWPDSGTK